MNEIIELSKIFVESDEDYILIKSDSGIQVCKKESLDYSVFDQDKECISYHWLHGETTALVWNTEVEDWCYLCFKCCTE